MEPPIGCGIGVSFATAAAEWLDQHIGCHVCDAIRSTSGAKPINAAMLVWRGRSWTNARLASTCASLNRACGISARYFASTSAQVIPLAPDPFGTYTVPVLVRPSLVRIITVAPWRYRATLCAGGAPTRTLSINSWIIGSVILDGVACTHEKSRSAARQRESGPGCAPW